MVALKTIRDLKLGTRKVDENVLEIYKKILHDNRCATFGKVDKTYDDYRSFIGKMDIDLENVQEMIDNLPAKKIKNARNTRFCGYVSVMASAMLNKITSRHPATYINTGYFGKYANYLGMKHALNTSVFDGDVGFYFAYRMRGGEQIVNGDAISSAGMGMKGGKLEIRGNAGDDLGLGMYKGTIRAKEAGTNVGNSMNGGKIFVDRCISVANDRKHGKVYVNDVLIPIGKEKKYGLEPKKF